MIDGFPLTTPCDTWRHLSATLSVDELIILGDGLTRHQHPYASIGMLGRALARHGGARGVRRLRDAFAEVRPGTDSARETVLRLLLVRAGLPEPEVNAEIELRDGTSTPGDLVYRIQKVIVEYDGRQHASDPRQFARDVLRLENLAAAGWTVIRVLARHLDDSPLAVISRVTSALKRGTTS